MHMGGMGNMSGIGMGNMSGMGMVMGGMGMGGMGMGGTGMGGMGMCGMGTGWMDMQMMAQMQQQKNAARDAFESYSSVVEETNRDQKLRMAKQVAMSRLW